MGEEVVWNLFSSLDANLILQIPISRRVMVDKLKWVPDCLGQFTVKSAYMVAWVLEILRLSS